MAGTTDQIRAKIQEKMLRIENVGQVHAYERYAKSNNKLLEFYQHQNNLRGWHIRRIQQQRVSPEIGRWTVTTRWNIRGFLSLNDDSQTEQAMDNLVDLIVAEFQPDEDLEGLVDCTTVGNESGIQLEDSGPYMFANVLCHGVRLALVTRHYE